LNIRVLFKKYLTEFKDYLRRKPFHLRNDSPVFFDCDDTLCMWIDHLDKSNPEFKEFKCPYTGESLFLKPHQKHIDLLKKYYFRGYAVVVWSHGGDLWSKEVVRVLGLEKYVAITMGKPSRYVDDLPAKEFMMQRVYIEE